MNENPQKAKKDFFISYNKADKSWAEWVAWQLEEAGYTTVIQAWDFRPGHDFVLKMQNATENCLRTIAILSQDYLDAVFTQPEWSAAFVRDPTGTEGILIPVRVKECSPAGMLGARDYIDLVNLDQEAAKKMLLEGIKRGRVKPSQPPHFPGKYHGATSPAFPGAPSHPSRRVWQIYLTVFLILGPGFVIWTRLGNNRSSLRGSVSKCDVTVATINNSKATAVNFELRLTNPGKPSTAWRWKLSARTPSNETFTSEALDLVAESKIQRPGSTNWIEYPANRYLPNVMLEKAIGDGSGLTGWVCFIFENVPMEKLDQNGTKFVIEFEQADSAKRYIEHVFLRGK